MINWTKPSLEDSETVRRYLMYSDVYKHRLALHHKGLETSANVQNAMDYMLHYLELAIQANKRRTNV